MISVTDRISLDESELHWDFVRSSGPGGQNVNKVATAVKLRFDAQRSANLSPEVKRRLKSLAGRRMTADGILIIDARRFRYQEKNREDALMRLVALVREAATPPRRRIKTAPSRAAREERVRDKKRAGVRKRMRARQAGEPED